MNFIERKQVSNLVEDVTRRLNLSENDKKTLENKLTQMSSFEQARNFIFQNMYLAKSSKTINPSNTKNNAKEETMLNPTNRTYTATPKVMRLTKTNKKAAFINEMYLAALTGLGLGISILCTIKLITII